MNKKALASLILGIITISVSILQFLIFSKEENFVFNILPKNITLSLYFLTYYLGMAPIAIFGIVIGIFGFKSETKKISVIGTVMSFIGLVSSIYLFLNAPRTW